MSTLAVTPNESRLSSMIDTLWEKKGLDKKDLPESVPASIVGHPCMRYIWLTFRWVCWQQTSGGAERKKTQENTEETLILNDLKALDIKAIDSNGNLLLSNIPEASATEHLFMFKLLSDAEFQTLTSKGLKDGLPLSYTALQYKLRGVAERALFIAEDRNTSELIAYRIRRDDGFAESIAERLESIISSNQIPAKCSEDDECTTCKNCDCFTFCHYWKRPQINCRTCAHFFAERDGKGKCSIFENSEIPLENQKQGCECHVMRSDLVDWQLDESRSNVYVGCYYIPDLGKTLFNGFGGVPTKDIMKEIWQHDTAERLSGEDSTIYF